MPRILLDPEDWQRGYQDGKQGRPGAGGQSMSYYSGWIEGDAAREQEPPDPPGWEGGFASNH